MSFLRDYRNSLKNIRAEEIVDLVLYRPLGFLVVVPLLRTSVTPNMLTLTALLFGVMGSFLLIVGGTDFRIPTIVAFIIYNVLDCADGQLARLKKNGTRFGRLMDGVIDYLVNIALYIAVAITLTRQTGDPFVSWILSVAAGLSGAAQALVFDYYRNTYLSASSGAIGSALSEELAVVRAELAHPQVSQNPKKRFFLFVYSTYLQSQDTLERRAFHPDRTGDAASGSILIRWWALLGTSTHLTLFLVCVAFGRLDLFVWIGIAGANIFMMILFLVQRLYRHNETVREIS